MIIFKQHNRLINNIEKNYFSSQEFYLYSYIGTLKPMNSYKITLLTIIGLLKSGYIARLNDHVHIISFQHMQTLHANSIHVQVRHFCYIRQVSLYDSTWSLHVYA